MYQFYLFYWEKLKKIKTKHGFPNYAETVGYVLQKFPEMIENTQKPAAPQAPAIVKPESVKEFVQLGEISGGRCDL